MSLVLSPRTVQWNRKFMRLRYRSGAIGEGSFGRVFMALITNESALRPVALKKVHITVRAKHPPLLHEAAVLLRLRGHRSIPEAYGWGSSQFFEYLSLQLLGPDLGTWFIRMEKPLTTRNLNAILWQMLDVLEYIHSQGIIHCDIKPYNVMLGRGNNKSHVFLGDFGISLPFDPTAPPSERTTLPRGSALYMSLNNHLRRALCPHDDMESLAYTIIELRMGILPWDRCCSHAEIFVLKQTWTGEHWTATTDCPKAFGDFLEVVRDRGQVLDYARWRQELCGDSTRTHPDAEPPVKYDPLDNDTPIRRNRYNASEPDQPLARELARAPDSPEPWPSLSGSEHGFNPYSTWPGPVTLKKAAAFEGELELVLRELALIDQLPTYGASQCATGMSEVMRPFGDILGEDIISKAGKDMGSDRGEMGNGSEQGDGGYSGSEGEGSDNNEDSGMESVLNDDSESDFRQFYDPEYGSD